MGDGSWELPSIDDLLSSLATQIEISLIYSLIKQAAGFSASAHTDFSALKGTEKKGSGPKPQAKPNPKSDPRPSPLIGAARAALESLPGQEWPSGLVVPSRPLRAPLGETFELGRTREELAGLPGALRLIRTGNCWVLGFGFGFGLQTMNCA